VPTPASLPALRRCVSRTKTFTAFRHKGEVGPTIELIDLLMKKANYVKRQQELLGINVHGDTYMCINSPMLEDDRLSIEIRPARP